MPAPLWSRWLGAVLGLLVVPLVYWTLRSLGENVSETTLTKEHHQLITSGPYRWVRHPLYTVGTLLLASCSLLTASWLIAAFTALVAVFVTSVVVPREEAAMIEKFGRRYEEYRRRTGRFLPRTPG